MTISIRIEGKTPLICNRFTDAAQMAASSGTRLSTIGDKGTPREQAETKLYRSKGSDDVLVIPSPNMFRCLIDAGTFFKVGKSKVTTLKTSMVPYCVSINEIEIAIISREGWDVDTRAVRIPSTGGRILCHRPCFNDWALEFTVELDTDVMNPKFFRELVDAAGNKIGLGDFRPATKGPYGRFAVTNWKNGEARRGLAGQGEARRGMAGQG